MGVSQYYDAMVKMNEARNADSKGTPPYAPPRGHDKELSESERAHIGPSKTEGHPFKTRHGQDALGKIK